MNYIIIIIIPDDALGQRVIGLMRRFAHQTVYSFIHSL